MSWSTGAVFHRERGWDHARRGGLAAHRALRAELGRPAAAAAAAVTTTRTAAWAARAGACLPSRLDQARGGFLAQPPALGPCERDSLSLRAAVPRHAGVPGLRCLPRIRSDRVWPDHYLLSLGYSYRVFVARLTDQVSLGVLQLRVKSALLQ